MAHKCPHCGAPLRSESSFCPHCATDIHPRKQAKTATPLLKKLLLGLLALAVLAAVGLGLWAAFAPRTYDGYGEVHYGDWQLLLTQHTDRYTPVPELTIPGEPEGQYRVPSRLFIRRTAPPPSNAPSPPTTRGRLSAPLSPSSTSPGRAARQSWYGPSK